jgi:glycosyltransferase involved in cell wall biosynthesis
VIDLAPSVFFAHDYNGTCISGSKSFKYPVVEPCDRRFGPACLAHYYPRRCGGLSPVTMFRLYGVQRRRLENLRRYDAIVTHSDHMLAELIKHGLSPQRAYNFPYFVQPASLSDSACGVERPPEDVTLSGPEETRACSPAGVRGAGAELRLLFSGRMEFLKGGHVLIAALPEVADALGKNIRVTFAGDGRERHSWERRARRARQPRLEIEFTGWVERARIESLLEACDLLVVPSLWPEPFGLVGPEAGLYGVPVAAFDVGGIADWLVNGVNGYLAPGRPPTSGGLARAIIECLQDRATHERLRVGARQVAAQFNFKNHLTALLEVFTSVTSRK